jgi:hypothetical protein
MRRGRRALLLGLIVLSAIAVIATAAAYRTIVERWQGDPRGTLIAAATVGVSFFVSTVLLLAWDDRRRGTPDSQERAE